MTASLLSGSRLIWLVNKASWSVVTAQVSLSSVVILPSPLCQFFCACEMGVDGLTEGTCYGNNLDFDDRSITSQSGFTLSTGRWGLGLVDWYEHLSVVQYGGGGNDYDNKDRRMMQMDTSHEQDNNIFTTAMNAVQTFITSFSASLTLFRFNTPTLTPPSTSLPPFLGPGLLLLPSIDIRRSPSPSFDLFLFLRNNFILTIKEPFFKLSI